MNNIKSLKERRKEVFDWLDNVIASYENYRDFTYFPGELKVSTIESIMNGDIIHIRNLETLCEYAGIPYISRISMTTLIMAEYKGYKLIDEII